MTTHTMRLKQPYFSMIVLGEKTYEIRLYDEKRRQIQPGDKIVFSHTYNDGRTSEVSTNVVGLVRAQTFSDLFDLIPVGKCGFSTKDDAISTMEKFYDKAAQKKYGVLAIAIKGDK